MPFRAEEKQKQKEKQKRQTMAPPISPEHSLNLNPVLCSILSENKTKTKQKLTKRTTNNFDNIELIEVNNQNIRQARIVF